MFESRTHLPREVPKEVVQHTIRESELFNSLKNEGSISHVDDYFTLSETVIATFEKDAHSTLIQSGDPAGEESSDSDGKDPNREKRIAVQMAYKDLYQKIPDWSAEKGNIKTYKALLKILEKYGHDGDAFKGYVEGRYKVDCMRGFEPIKKAYRTICASEEFEKLTSLEKPLENPIPGASIMITEDEIDTDLFEYVSDELIVTEDVEKNYLKNLSQGVSSKKRKQFVVSLAHSGLAAETIIERISVLYVSAPLKQRVTLYNHILKQYPAAAPSVLAERIEDRDLLIEAGKKEEDLFYKRPKRVKRSRKEPPFDPSRYVKVERVKKADLKTQ